MIKQLIDLRVHGQETPISSSLIQHLSGLEFKEDQIDLMHYLYDRLNHAEISSLDHNFIAQYACKKQDLLMQVLFETTVLGVNLDLQTYLKVLIALYNETPSLSKESQLLSEAEKKQALILVYLLFRNDCGEKDFNFGCELLYEYVNADTNNPN